MKQYMLFILLLLSQFKATADNIQFETYTTADGLSQNTVTSIVQDQYGFLWFGTRDGLNRYDGVSFRSFRDTHVPGSGLDDNYIRKLTLGTDNTIWIGTTAGVFCYSYPLDRITQLQLPSMTDDPQQPPVECLETAENGDVWILTRNNIFVVRAGTDQAVLAFSSSDLLLTTIAHDNDRIYLSGSDGGLHYTDDEFATLNDVLDDDGNRMFKDDLVTCILPRQNGRLFLGMQRSGVAVIDPMSHGSRRLDLGVEASTDIFVRSILQNGEEELWIGTESGLFIYDLLSGECQHLKSSYYDDRALSDNAIYSIFKDSFGGIWVGSFFGGVNYLPADGKQIARYYPTGEKGSIKGKRVRDIRPDGKGCFWIGTEDAGLYHFNPKTGDFDFFEESRDFTNIHDLLIVGDKLWVSTFGQGIKVIDTATGRLKSYTAGDGFSNIDSDFIFSFLHTDDGKIYVGTVNTLQCYDSSSDRFEYVQGIGRGGFIRDLYVDSNGCMWVSAGMLGLYMRDPDSQDWHFFAHDPYDATSIPSNNISGIFEDSRHTLWLTTEGDGFCRYENGAFKTFNTSDGIPSDAVCTIVEDDRGYFWVSTFGGLALFDPVKEKVLDVFTQEDGLLSSQFNNKSGYKDETGRIWFGTINGLMSFSPQTLTKRRGKEEMQAYITDLYISDRHVSAGEDGSPLVKGIIGTESFSLSHRQNNITLRLVSPQYAHARSARIQYMMAGYDNDWRTLLSNGSQVSYPQLPPGRYEFLTKVSNADDSLRSMRIRVLPPWYRHWLAYVIYSFLLAAAFIVANKWVAENNNRKEAIRRHQYDVAKAKELYDSRISFYTNIAHEIRTPLTLINGPLEHLLNTDIPDDAKEDLRVMGKNSTRLLNLVNELLDFNKVEGQGLILDFIEADVSDLISKTVYRFSSEAKQSGKNIVLSLPEQPVIAVLDAEAVTKVFSNLLSNAMKYSDTMITVSLETSEHSLFLRVINDGATIPAENREKIFEPFFRADEHSQTIGSGIGLPYARSLARVHGGDIIVEDVKERTSFCVILPYQPSSAAPHLDTDNTNKDSKEKCRCILIVEDNTDMRAFEERILAPDYAILSACNGVDALEMLRSRNVDMVISDVMMPEMDGLELVNRIKGDMMLCHIPVVLLTAKTSTESKIEGANAGADLYVEKPFSPDYLKSVVSNFFVSRDRLAERIQKYPLSPIGNVSSSEADNELITKIHDIIMDNLQNPEFSVDDIARELAMSRSSFYRKIKGTLNMNPNEYLRLERLKEAARLIKERKYSLTEISYMVGFNSPSYFSKCFQKQFGIQPKDF